jgi:hypothetical protein
MTTLKLGYTDPRTDVFGAHPVLGAVLDLNDGQTYTLIAPEGLELPPPPRTLVPAGNIRTQGERVMRAVYRHNREAVCRLVLGPMASEAALVAAMRTLLLWVNAPPGVPFTIQYQPFGASVASYLDVVGCACDLPEDESEWLRLQFEPIELVFLCRPGLRGDRQWLSNMVPNPGFEQPMGGGTATTAPLVFTDNLTTGNAYVTLAGSAASLSAQQLTIPSGAVIGFGSPAWGAVQTWQVRFSWLSGQSAQFFLHWTDANNKFYIQADGTNLSAAQVVGGTAHALGSVAAALANTVYYWLRITQFPSVPGDPPDVQAVILNDSAGAPGTVLATLSAVQTFDAVTALVGRPAFGSNGVNLLIGGISGVSNSVALFGPGGWNFVSATGANGPASFAWEGDVGRGASGQPGNTYPNGPVTSYGALRMDVAPAGSLSAQADLYTGGAAAGTQAMPIKTAGNVFGVAVWVKSSGLSGTAAIAVYLREFDSTGAFLRQTLIGSLTGNQASWTRISGTATTGVTATYADLLLTISDTTANSANGTVWFDNAQVWDQTRTGMAAMPYCELVFPNSPGMLMVSGLLGDLPCPCHLQLGTYVSSWAKGGTLSYAAGRLGSYKPNAVLAAASVGFYGTTIPPQATAVLDGTSYGGYFVKATVNNGTGWNPRGVSPRVSDAQGVYHLLMRYRTADATPTGVLVRPLLDHTLDPWYTDLLTLGVLGTYYGPYQNPLSAANVWTVADVGQLVVPPFPLPGMADGTQTYATPRAQWIGTTGPGAEGDAGWVCLLPVDGSLVTGVVNNPSNNTVAAVTSSYVWVYVDGLLVNQASSAAGPSSTYSVEGTALSNVGHAGGGVGTLNTGSLNVNGGADPYLTLDPTLAGSAGVNQLVGYVADQGGAVQALYAEVLYSPLYLQPR